MVVILALLSFAGLIRHAIHLMKYFPLFCICCQVIVYNCSEIAQPASITLSFQHSVTRSSGILTPNSSIYLLQPQKFQTSLTEGWYSEHQRSVQTRDDPAILDFLLGLQSQEILRKFSYILRPWLITDSPT